jgi:hypothetical protein
MILTLSQCIMSMDVQSVALLPENRISPASTWIRYSVLGHQRGSRLPAAMFALEFGARPYSDMNLHYHFNVHLYLPEMAIPFFSSLADQIVALETSTRRKPLDARNFAVTITPYPSPGH